MLLRAGPDLCLGHELVALSSRADKDIEIFRPRARGGRIDRQAALRTEDLLAFGAALGRFHIDCRFAR